MVYYLVQHDMGVRGLEFALLLLVTEKIHRASTPIRLLQAGKHKFLPWLMQSGKRLIAEFCIVRDTSW